jgi:ribosomal protein S18 acetylase RimI-like enzyme
VSEIRVPEIRVRRATAEDYPAAGAVTLAAYQPFLRGPDDDYAAWLVDAAARDAEAELWVAVGDGGDLLGCVTLCPPGSPWREIARDDEGEFRMLAVSPDAQGRGVGRALVQLVLDRFHGDGAAAVVMSSLAEMRTAHRLYERLGFTRLTERDWHPLPEITLIAFRRTL